MAPHFELEPHRRNVPDENLVADLLRVSKELAKPTVTIDQYNERGRFHSYSLTRRFGSRFKALERAGLARSRTLHIANEDLFQNLVEVSTRLGRQAPPSPWSELKGQVLLGSEAFVAKMWPLLEGKEHSRKSPAPTARGAPARIEQPHFAARAIRQTDA